MTTIFVCSYCNVTQTSQPSTKKNSSRGIRAAGGAHLVLISASMLNSVKMAHSRNADIDKSLDLEKFSKRNDSDFSLSLARS